MEESSNPKPHVHFAVEKVIGISDDGNYQVQWAPAWVSKFHLVGCEHLIREFLQRHSEEEQVNKTQQETSSQLKELSPFQFEIPPFQNNECAPISQRTDEFCDMDDKPAVDELYDCHHDNQGGANLSAQYKASTIGNPPAESSSRNFDGRDVLEEEQICEPKDDQILQLNAIDDIVVKVEENNDKNNEDGFPSYLEEPSPPLNMYQDRGNVLTENNTIVLAVTENDAFVEPSTILQETHTCTICHRDFPNQMSLHLHLMVHNNEVRPHRCQHCSRGFTSHGNLKQHLRTHTGEKPYTCSTCTKSFTRKADLERHALIHQRLYSGSKEYSCDSCSKTFTQACQLHKHRRRCLGSDASTSKSENQMDDDKFHEK